MITPLADYFGCCQTDFCSERLIRKSAAELLPIAWQPGHRSTDRRRSGPTPRTDCSD